MSKLINITFRKPIFLHKSHSPFLNGLTPNVHTIQPNRLKPKWWFVKCSGVSYSYYMERQAEWKPALSFLAKSLLKDRLGWQKFCKDTTYPPHARKTTWLSSCHVYHWCSLRWRHKLVRIGLHSHPISTASNLSACPYSARSRMVRSIRHSSTGSD